MPLCPAEFCHRNEADFCHYIVYLLLKIFLKVTKVVENGTIKPLIPIAFQSKGKLQHLIKYKYDIATNFGIYKIIQGRKLQRKQKKR